MRRLADAERARMMAVVMKPAQEQKVFETGFPAQGPVLVVMGFRAIRRHAAPGKAAEAISDVERQAQPVRHHALLATNVDGQAVAFGHADNLGIAADPPPPGRRHWCTPSDLAPPAPCPP